MRGACDGPRRQEEVRELNLAGRGVLRYEQLGGDQIIEQLQRHCGVLTGWVSGRRLLDGGSAADRGGVV